MQKVAIVTGSSRGIGKEIALKLSAEGFAIVINYLSNKTAAEEVAKQVENAGGQTLIVKADISSKNESENLVEQTIKTFGRIDVLVNNAGITRDNLLIRMSLEEWQAVLQTNFTGIMNLTELVIDIMQRQETGKIINLSSTVGVHGNAGQANYATAKSALLSYTKIKARELMPKIQVNAIAPGLVQTDMTANFDLEKLSKTKLGRAASPSDIAECVVWLVKPSGNYITGQIIEIDGGLFLWADIEALAK
jgi:3-oxoacyl-[acyl-carrier protein] reductase